MQNQGMLIVCMAYDKLDDCTKMMLQKSNILIVTLQAGCKVVWHRHNVVTQDRIGGAGDRGPSAQWEQY